MKIRSVWVKEGVIDRYTVVFEGDKDGRFPCLGLSAEPHSPQGVSQWGLCEEGEHLGKKIPLKMLPDNILAHVLGRTIERGC